MSWYKIASIQKKETMEYKGRKVLFVDEKTIRDLSLEDEEFTDFAIHNDFPKLIPKNEIWISEEVNKEEIIFFLENASKHYDLIEKGYDNDEAYERALKYEKSLREKSKKAKGYYAPTQYSKRPPSKIYIRKYATIADEITVWIVNGKMVRDLYKTDYVEGGHGYVYSWIPNDEIWIDSDIKEEEIMDVVTHEYTELLLMRDKDMEYNKAHQLASIEEYKFRKKEKDFWFFVQK